MVGEGMVLRDDCPQLEVPWYALDEDVAGALEEIIGSDVEIGEPPQESRMRGREQPRDGTPASITPANKTPSRQLPAHVESLRVPSDHDNVEKGGQQMVEVLVHQGEVPTTTAVATKSSTLRVNGPAASSANYASIQSASNVNGALKKTPRDTTMRGRGGLGLPLAPAWEYYSAHLYRGLPATRQFREANNALATPRGVRPALRPVQSPERAKPLPQ